MEPQETAQQTPKQTSQMPVIVGGIVVITALVGGFFFLGQNKQTTPAENTPNAAVTDGATPMMEEKTMSYTLADVQAHATETDCWMAIDGKVYDATEYIATHPGGKAIVGGCGKDASTLFNERPTNDKGPHPDQAKAALAELYIGDLQ